ncbi:putative endonuclease [Wigglesworthia glossinidia endosymbiont of Glossina morsitans morsitans (Yale colony)]|uniref:phospholipase D n=1 Tax=Wigglesworthia glossinidia endosymbiont of Glossina morsitans morsitans (Yale colony) TaxID=1142511 RepID=H6Q4X5_WIGGL|nr:phospholipase D family protein [Wigglesworthia glossinidia]AFA41258.1 putative endonuclease [Wigglesworthia glossinidia endosymbiont of Glossina morsitans morsitans (Yale colony)]
MKQFFFIFLIFFNFINSNVVLSANCYTDPNSIRIGFSPGNTAQKIILDAIKESSISIDIAAYSFTSKLISLALMDAEHRGVKIRVLADKKSNSGKYTAVTYLSNHKIPVRLNDKYSIMHNKFMIIDHKSVQTGSFNYTQSAANKNAENVIFIKNSAEIAEKYELEFNRLWNEALEQHKNYLINK